MIERLGTGSVYHWISLLAWSCRNRTSGDFFGMSTEDIELHAKWPNFIVKKEPYKGRKSRGLFVEVLLEVKFLESCEQGLKWHDCSENQPYVAKEQERIAASKAANEAKKTKQLERQQKLMEGHRAIAQAERIAEEQEAVTAKPESGHAPSLPNPSLPSQKQKLCAEAPKARGCRLPKDFKVEPHHRAFAAKENLPNPDSEIDAFRDHFASAPGNKGVKLDWHAAFRNWLRRAKQYGATNGKQTTNSRNQNRTIESVQAALRRNAGLDHRAVRVSVDSDGPSDERRTIDAIRPGTPRLQSASVTDCLEPYKA